MKLSFLFLVIILLTNFTFVKSIDISSKDENIPSKYRKSNNEDQNYLIFINNTFGEINIFSKPKNLKRQEVDSYEFTFALMDDIHNLIIENKDTFKDPEKLIEIENNKLKKRNVKSQPITVYDNSSLVHLISSVKNSTVIKAYLSQDLVEKVQQMENVKAVLPDEPVDAYTNYNKNDILEETKWKDFSVRENADFHLSLLSQGKYKDSLVSEYDTNYYYPSSAGKDIDIILLDDSFYFDYSEFNNTDRIVKCEAYVDNDDEIHVPELNSSCGQLTLYKDHGRILSDIVGGYVHGVANNANVYGIAMVSYGAGSFFLSTIFKGLEYIKDNMIRPHKTIINLSFGGYYEIEEESYKHYELIINEITEKGGIVVCAAGNSGKDIHRTYSAPYTENDVIVRYITFDEIILPCAFKNTICVGGIESVNSDYFIEMDYTKAEESNYGDQVNVYAPFYVSAEYIKDIKDGESDIYKVEGTSFSAPITAGVIATIMSEYPEIEFTTETLLQHLKENSIPFNFNNELNYMVNNGKHIVYSKNDEYKGCGVSSGNRSCESTCKAESCNLIESMKSDCYLNNGEFLFDPKYKESHNYDYSCMISFPEKSEETNKFGSLCMIVNDVYKCVYSKCTSYKECDESSDDYNPESCFNKIFEFLEIRDFYSDVIEYYREQCENKSGVFLRDETGDFICLDYYFGPEISNGHYCVSARFSKDGRTLKYAKNFYVNNEKTNYNICNETYFEGSNRKDCFELIQNMFKNELFLVDHDFSLEITRRY